jgi:hypothetical protein
MFFYQGKSINTMGLRVHIIIVVEIMSVLSLNKLTFTFHVVNLS